MSGDNGTAREIDLGDEFGAVVVKVNGVRVEIGRDGIVTATNTHAMKALPKDKYGAYFDIHAGA